MPAKPTPEITRDSMPFWDGCAAGELRVQRCRECGGDQLPPRARCLACGADDLDWRAIPARGVVHSFTVVHRAPSEAFRADVPYVVALVDVAARARLMMNVTGCDPDQMHIGMQVRIDFERRDGGEPAVTVPVAQPVGEERCVEPAPGR